MGAYLMFFALDIIALIAILYYGIPYWKNKHKHEIEA
jgi:hypothetical protein